MVGHHIGPNRMHPDRISCLSLSANDHVVSTFSEQKLRSVYSTLHALGLAPASTIPRDGTGWYKPLGMYCGVITLEYLLLEKLSLSHKIPFVK